ncbi:MAG: radical SAM protein [Planctomycetota bacterium]
MIHAEVAAASTENSTATGPGASPAILVEGHKLHHHLDRVVPFLRGERIYPLYVEFSPVGSCNHRCTFCAYDYIGYPDRRLDTARTREVLAEMGRLGVKSTLWAGEGEPLLHPEIGELAQAARQSGMDVGMFSNASALNERKALGLLPHLTFLRVSFNAGTPETYAATHRAPAKHFALVLQNIERAVALRAQRGWSVTLGMQIVLLPDNLATLPELARIAQGLGVDYLAVKPFVQHPDQEGLHWPESFSPDAIEAVAQVAESFQNERFKVLVRRESFRNYQRRSYRHCHALPFFAFVLSDGNVYTCGPYYGHADHVYGNINTQSFREIWQSERAAAIQCHAATKLDAQKCMPNCRPDAANRFLWELKNPPAHVNFI